MNPPALFVGLRRRLLGWVLISTLLQAVAFVTVAVATRRVFVALHAGSGLPVAEIALVGAAGACAAVMQLTIRVLAEHLGQDFAKDVRLTLFDHASRSDQNELNQKRLGYHVLRFTGDLTALKGWPSLGLPRLVQASVLLPVSTAVLIYLDKQFAWAAVCALLPTAIWVPLSQRRLVRAHRTLRQRRARLAADATERLPIAPRLAALGRRRTESNLLSRRATQVVETARGLYGLIEVRKAVPEVSAAVAASLIMWIGALEGMPAGTIAAALATLGLMIRPLRNAMASGDQAARFHIAHNKLIRALQRPLSTRTNSKSRLRRKPVSVEVTSHHGPALKLAPGQTEAVSKTLMDQIETAFTGNSKLVDVKLKLDGKDISNLSPGSLRRCVGIVTERPLILKGSMRRAVTLGLRTRPSDDQILQAARDTGLMNVINDMGGLSSKLSERGANLSADQRLAISCLHLMLQKPGVILVLSAPPVRVRASTMWQIATKLVTLPYPSGKS